VKKKKKTLNLAKTEYIITAYGANCAGPGWANSPIFVVIRDGATGKIRETAIQPEDQTKEMVDIFAFSALAHSRMTGLVRELG
jgi:hypothetical protein